MDAKADGKAGWTPPTNDNTARRRIRSQDGHELAVLGAGNQSSSSIQLRVDDAKDAIQVILAGELNGDFAFVLTDIDLHPGVIDV